MSLFTNLRDLRAQAQTRADQIIAAVEADGRTDLTDEERTEFEAATADLESIDARLADVLELQERRQAAERTLTALEDTAEERAEETAKVPARFDARPRSDVYSRASGNSFMRDLISAALPNQGSVEPHNRLAAYEAEQQRAGLTTVDGAGGTFVPPMYLIDEYVPFARPGRPFADRCVNLTLPKGTDSINLPKVTAGTSVGLQGTQNTAVTEVDLTDAYVSSSVITLAGQQTVSLQLIEQSPIAFDEVVMQDLTLAHDVATDVQTISGSGTGGNLTGVLSVSGANAVTYTSTTPTQAALWPSILQAISLVNKTRYLPPTAIWMHPSRWAWLSAGQDTANRPFVLPAAQGPFNAVGVMDGVPKTQGPVGQLAGLPVFTDVSIPTNLGAGTNQDTIIVARMEDLYLWEGSLTARALPQTLGSQLSILLQVYRYAAFIGSRYPTAIASIGGTGLVMPAGY